MDQPLFIAFAGAAITAAMIVVAVAGWMLGLELGPLATWLSGAASFTAVVVALQGHRRVERERLADKADTKQAAAQQVMLKLDRLLSACTYVRRNYRETARVLRFRCGQEEYVLVVRVPILTGMSVDHLKLTQEQENLFVSGDALAALATLDLALRRYEAVLGLIAYHADLHRQLEAMAEGRRITFGSTAPAVQVIADAQVFTNVRDQSASTKAVLTRSTEMLQNAVDAVAPVQAAMASFLQDRAVARLDTGYDLTELAVAVPAVSAPAPDVAPTEAET